MSAATTTMRRLIVAAFVLAMVGYVVVVGVGNYSTMHDIRCAHGHLGEPGCEVAP